MKLLGGEEQRDEGERVRGGWKREERGNDYEGGKERRRGEGV